MADEPSNAELAWRLERIQDTLSGVIGRPEYGADKRGTDHRLTELERDMADERRDRAAAIDDLKRLIGDQAKAAEGNRVHWRTLLWTGVIPAIVAAIGVVLTWAINHGGH